MASSLKRLFFLLCVLIWQISPISSYYKGLDGDADIFENPRCKETMLSRNVCECDGFNAECLSPGCDVCKCRKKTRIYRSDVRKCLTDIEARDPWCRYQFINTRSDVIPTINLSKKCPQNKCSKPINAPFDKTKHSCGFGWVNYLENGTWHDEKVEKFKNTFHLKSLDYFSDRGYSYSLEWKGSKFTPIRKRLLQVSLECLDQDGMKESYCLMFQVRGRNNPILLAGAKERQKTTQLQTPSTNTASVFRRLVRTARPTRLRGNRNKKEMEDPKIVVVSDNFTVILAAIAGALGTAMIILPVALCCRRSSRRPGSMRTHSANSEQPSTSFGEEIELEPQTSEETLGSYSSLKQQRDPPPLYQPLRRVNGDETPDEEPIYITVSGDDPEQPVVKIPPIYHVLEELSPSDETTNRDENGEC